MTALDSLLTKRKSTRSFTDRMPERSDIEQIIEAGRTAPFAGLAQRNCDRFRHFFVIGSSHPAVEKLIDIVDVGRKANAAKMIADGLREKYPENMAMIEKIIQTPPRNMFVSPCTIVIAERAGVPRREAVCLGYVLENMWLKATELGLGFKIDSGVCDVVDKAPLIDLFGLDPNEDYAFDACSIGYADNDPGDRTVHERPEPSVTWMMD